MTVSSIGIQVTELAVIAASGAVCWHDWRRRGARRARIAAAVITVLFVLTVMMFIVVDALA